MNNGIRSINSSAHIIVAADKSRNMHKISYENYDKLVNNSITQNYQRAQDNISETIATEYRNLLKNIR